MRWKSRKMFCKDCNTTTVHAYDSFSGKGKLTRIFICRACEKTTIKHRYKNKKFVVRS